ncbi:MAG: SusC/RagA family TonB-linked outer membrane protein [Saprospiraceae bacterium]
MKFLLAITFLVSSIVAYGQQRITGVVLNNDNLPLSGASVSNTTTSATVITNDDGSFMIDAIQNQALEIFYIGYSTQRIFIQSATNLRIVLQPLVINLNEIVVTGYTTQKVKEITGSVAVVRPKDLTAIPVGQVEQMLQGRVAGLTVITSGEPGSASNVRLHGIGNFGNVTPLYVIDGVEGNINSINPYDIESLQVLKDAGAYSIYGVRGANGVIVITTKKGKGSKTKIDYDFYISSTRPLKHGLDLLNPQENADLLWIALKNSKQVSANGNPSTPRFGNGPMPVLPDYLFAGHHIDTLYEGSPYVNPSLYNIDKSAGAIYQIQKFNKTGTDWFHETFKPALSQNHTITVSGGNDYNHFLFSMGYLDQQGTLINTSLKRYTARVNTEFTALDVIRIGENLQISSSQNPNTGNSIYPSLMTDPYLAVYDIKGNPGSYGDGYAGLASNPLSSRLLSKDNIGNNWQLFGNTYLEADILKKFTLRSSFGGNLNYYYAYNFLYGSYEPPPTGLLNSFTERSGYARSWTWTNTINYSGTIKDHHIKAFAGVEEKSNYNREQGGARRGYFINDPNYRFLSNGIPTSQSNYSFAGTSYLYSFISQANYNFKEKYFLSGTLRRDGSSVFGPENRFGWFPAVGLAWRVTEEKFAQDFKWLTDLKLRASWGKTGFSANTDPFNQYTLYGGFAGSSYYDIYGTSNSVQQGFNTVRIGNARTGWQEDVVSNIGFESVLLNGKLSITADWYAKKSNGLLFPISLPALLGDANPPNVNTGNVKNTGIDLLIGSKGKLIKDWNWDASLTLSHYNNKITKLNDIPYFDAFFTRYGPFIRNEVGYPISSFYGYKVIGYFDDAEDVAKSPVQEAAAPGRFKYFDANGDGQITDKDRVHYGNPNPQLTMGLNVGLNYKNFDFSTFFYGSFGNDVLNDLRYSINVFASQLGLTPKSKTALYDSWTPQNHNAKAPIIENDQNFSNSAVVNSYALEKGSYIRNKSLMVGYSFPKTLSNKIKMDRLRIYIQSSNLFTITKYKGLDPELSGTSSAYGIDSNGNYPNNEKKWIIGFSLGL